jgi:arsenite methyltransferase
MIEFHDQLQSMFRAIYSVSGEKTVCHQPPAFPCLSFDYQELSMFTALFLKLLNKEASSLKSRSDEIMRSFLIREGSAIADIGSGGGYFTLLFAGEVGKTGRIYAVDVKPRYLDFIRRSAERAGIHNISYVLGAGRELDLPQAGLDLIFARNVFHHLPEPGKYFRDLKKYLKPSGQIAIIEHKPKAGFGFVGLFKHHTLVATIAEDMEKAGFVVVKSFDFLTEQSFTLLGLK